MQEAYDGRSYRNADLSLKNIRAGVKLNEGSNILELTLDMEGVDTEELKYLLQSFRMKKKYYRLKNGSFIPLGSGELNTVAKLLEDFWGFLI